MLETSGFFLSVAVLVYLSFKGFNPIITSILAAVVVGLTNKIAIGEIFSGYYMPGAVGFIQSWFLIFVIGAIFSELLTQSGSVSSVAYSLLKLFGEKNAVAVVAVITAVLTIGGVNPYVQIFIVWPICIVFSRQTNISRGVWIGVHYLGMFSAYSFPGNPSMANVILSEGLGVASSSMTVFSLCIFALNFAVGLTYFNLLVRSQKKRGIGYIETPRDKKYTGAENSERPPFLAAVSPMLCVVLLYIAISSGLIPFLKNLTSANAIILSMLMGSAVCTVLNYRFLKGKIKTSLSSGSMAGVSPVITAAVITGYLSVFMASDAYGMLIGFIKGISFGSYAQAFVACNVITFITGSGTVAVNPVVSAFKESWILSGVNLNALRPVMAASVAGVSISPHSGGLSGVLGFTDSTLKESYLPILFGVVLTSLFSSFVASLVAGIIF